ncbi:MAG TPA: purine-nucleoside phosphorylase, partial [Acidimicrobiales bacterium]|nr:purine-nucleoside phosphorylase [Acidimicrobiales bacterium]
VVLGTGLAGVAERLGATGTPVELTALPWFPRFSGLGHRAEAWSVERSGLQVLVTAGRAHLYEDRTPAEVAQPVRTAIATGCRAVILTCSCGAISPDLPVGRMVLVADHLNLTGASPLTGAVSVHPPTPFVDLTDAWSPRLRGLAKEVDPDLAEGVYAQMTGPHLETPAEVRMLAGLGADLVGMSMALEAIAARHLGVEVLGLAVVTNMAAGVAPGGTSVDDITKVAEGAVDDVARVAAGVIDRLARDG